MGKFPQTLLADPGGDDRRMVTLTEDTTLTTDDHMKVFFIATDAITVTLPSATAGVEYTFINSGADGANIITISPAAADAVHGTFTLAASVVELSGTVDKDVLNTKATANTGDMAKIVCDGTAWYVTAGTGIWASEA